jgi:hypothetical protein|tara:strand:- start:12 stop:314 length:303 start_codon:yes stop_codon:yes gene_type:complete
MDAIFKALASMPTPKKKIHTVVIEGQEIEVSLQQKLEIQRAGEYAYMIKDGRIEPKPRKKSVLRYPVLVKGEIGGHFQDGDPFWIDRIEEKGYQWQIKPE